MDESARDLKKYFEFYKRASSLPLDYGRPNNHYKSDWHTIRITFFILLKEPIKSPPILTRDNGILN
jgi:hypothetical protein